MITKEWLIEQGVLTNKYQKEIFYDIGLKDANRKISISIEEKDSNVFIIDIIFYEDTICLATYALDFFDENYIQILVQKWLKEKLVLEVIKQQHEQLIIQELYKYFLVFGKDANKAYSWDKAKQSIKKLQTNNNKLEILYELCRNIDIWYQFNCQLHDYAMYFTYQASLLEEMSPLFKIEIKSEDIYLVEIQNLSYHENTNPKQLKVVKEVQEQVYRFTTPQEAVTCLQMILNEFLKQQTLKK